MDVSVGAQHVGQRCGVGWVRLRASLAVTLAVARQRLGVDRVDREPGGGERDDEQVLVGLDRHRCRLRIAAVLGDQLQ